jgi:hypothetical protein
MKKNKNVIFSLIAVAILIFPLHIKAQIIKIGSDTATVGEEILIPLQTSGLMNIGAMDIKIVFDSTKLIYIKDTLLSPDAMGILSNVINVNSVFKQINISWLSMGTTGVNITPGDFMFFKFKYLGGNANLNFNLVDCEVVDWDGNLINVSFINGIVVPSLGANFSVWNGNNVWSNAANWSNGIPGSATNIIINSGIVELNVMANCNDIQVKNGASLIIKPDMAINIYGNIENFGNIIIKSDTSGTGSLINYGNYAGNGNVNVERYIHKLNPNDFSLFTTPFNNIIVNSSTTGNSIIKSYSEQSQNWVTVNQNDNLVRGKGYSIIPSSEITVNFSDTSLTGGSFFYNNLTYTNNPLSSVPNGLNLVGNPYTSAIDWSNSGIVKSNIDASIYCFNGVNYISWNGQIGAFNDGIVPSLQGFFVRANAANPVLQIPDSARIHNNKSFLKKSQKNINNLLMIIAEGNSYSDIAYLNFNQNATQSFDSNFDAYKLFGIDDAPQVYTTIPSTNTKLSINVIDALNTNLYIPIGYKVGVAGNYSIKFENLSSFSPTTNFFLHDVKTSNIINLRTSPSYSFNASPNDIAERFILSFVDPTGISENADNSIIYNFENNHLDILFDNFKEKVSIKVSNILGQEIKNYNFKNTKRCSIDFNNKGCYIISIIADNSIYNKKIVVGD